MGVMQEEFDRATAASFSFEDVKKLTIRQAAKRHGITVSDQKLSELLKGIDNTTDETDTRLIITDVAGVHLELTDEDLKAALLEVEVRVDKAIHGAVTATLDQIPKNVLGSLYADAARMIREHRKLTKGFERRLYAHWQEGLDRLKMLIVIAQESGATHRADLANVLRQGTSKKSKEVFDLADALVGLHFRACRIASEVLCLLKGGFAEGAYARWRSLHEVAVIGMFLAQHKKDVASRYLKHSAVEQLRSAVQFQIHCRRLGYRRISGRKMAELQSAHDRYISEYGESFAREYGWASNVLKKKAPTFVDLEQSLRLAHWRPHFKMACQSIHAGSRALVYNIASPTGQPHVGASNAGLTDPGHCTAISLTMITTTLLTFQANIDGLVTSSAMRLLTKDIRSAFFEAQDKLESKIQNIDG